MEFIPFCARIQHRIPAIGVKEHLSNPWIEGCEWHVFDLVNAHNDVDVSLLVRSSLAALLLNPRLFRASINSVSVPQRAPALLRGTQLRVLHGRNPDVTAHITAASANSLPSHSRIIHNALSA